MEAAIHTKALEEVRQEIAELERRISQLRTVAEYHASKAGSNGMPAKTQEMPSAKPIARIGKIGDADLHDRFAKMGQREAAEAVLREFSCPLRAGDVAREMVAGGFKYPGTVNSLANSLFTSFKRGPNRFKKVSAGLWALIDYQPPEGSEIDD